MKTFTIVFEGHSDIEANTQAEAKEKFDNLINGMISGDMEIDNFEFEDDYDDEDSEDE